MADFIDVITGLPLTPAGIGTTIISGKVGSSLRQSQRVAFETAADVLLSFAPATEWTICGWVRPVTHDVSTTSGFYIDLIGNDNGSEILVSFDFKNQTFYGLLDAVDGFVDELQDVPDAGISLVGGDWFFFLVEVRAGILGVQINNGTLHTATTPAVWDTEATGSFVIQTALGGGPSQTQDLDEVVIFKSALTDDQKAILFNSGAGTTWPLP